MKELSIPEAIKVLNIERRISQGLSRDEYIYYFSHCYEANAMKANGQLGEAYEDKEALFDRS